MTTYVLHHADTDGRVGGWCAWTKFYFSAHYIEVQYGQPFPLNVSDLTKEDSVYIIDFSYDRQCLMDVAEKVGTLVVLDHHDTAEKELEGLSFAHFDRTKSGALMAWEYFRGDAPVPWGVTYADDYDLWQHKHPESRYFEAGVRHYRLKQDWVQWNNIMHEADTLHNVLKVGKIVCDNDDSYVHSFIRNRSAFVGTYRAASGVAMRYAMCNSSHCRNDLADALFKMSNLDFVVVWYVSNDGIKFSLRSRQGGIANVGAIAKAMGGGGRENTAAVFLPFHKGHDLVTQLMAETSVYKPE